MKKVLCMIVTISMIMSIFVPVSINATAIPDEDGNYKVIVSEDLTLQSSNQAYTDASILVKRQQGSTQRVALLKFDLTDIDLNEIGSVYLNLYALQRNGFGQDNPTKIAVYWSNDISWSESDTSFSIVQNMERAEVGDNLISLPSISGNANKYHQFDISQILRINDMNKKFTLVLQIKETNLSSSQGGYVFADRTVAGCEPYLTLCKGIVPPESHIKNGQVILADNDVEMAGDNVNPSADTITISGNRKGLLKFDLSQYSGDIAGAGLRLYVSGIDNLHDTIIKVIGVTAEWTEDGLPAEVVTGEQEVEYIIYSCKGTEYWIDIDISEIVSNAQDIGNLSLMVEQVGNDSSGFSFYTREKKTYLGPHIVVRTISGTSRKNNATLRVLEDIYVDNTSSTKDMNYNHELLLIKNNSAARKAFIKFDLSDVEFTSDDITAVLSVNYVSKSGYGLDNMTNVNVYYCPDNDWSEKTLTGAKSASMYAAALKPENLAGTLRFAEYDKDAGLHLVQIGKMFTKYIDNTYSRCITLMLIQEETPGSNGGVALASKEQDITKAVKLDVSPNIPTGLLAVPAAEDTYVRLGSESGKNFGSEEILIVKNDIKGGAYIRQAFIKVDLSKVPENRNGIVKLLLPVSRVFLSSVRDKLYATANYEKPWSQNTLTANLVESEYTYLKTENMVHITDFDVPRSMEGKYYEIDVSDYINECIENQYREVTFKIEGDTLNYENGDNFIYYSSTKTGFKPMIAYGFDPVIKVGNKKIEGDRLSANLALDMNVANGWIVSETQGGQGQKVAVIIAGYDSNGTLLGVDIIEDAELTAQYQNFSSTISGASTVKLFVWSNMSEIKPYKQIEHN